MNFENLNEENGRICIKSREKQKRKHLLNEDGLFPVKKRTEEYCEAKTALKTDNDNASVYDSFSDVTLKEKKHKKKSKKKKNKKNKKKVDSLSKKLDTSERKYNSGQILSGILAKEFKIRVIGKSVYIYDDNTGYFKFSDKQALQTRLYSWLTENRNDADKFSKREFDEAYSSLLIKADIQRECMANAYNTPYVLCNNGVLNLENMTLKPFSAKHEFTSGTNARYDEDAEGEKFKAFINYITNGDKELKKLLQEIIGYTLSNYTHMRTAFMLLGVKGSGKSTLLDIIRYLIGEDNISAVNMQDMENEYYVSAILKAKLNIVPDIPDSPIKGEISKFKSLVSDSDVVTGRDPGEKPYTARCRSKMLFGSNHHVRFIGISHDDLEAFFDRVYYIPFNCCITERKEGYGDILKGECDYIFTWAMKGMKRLMDNGFKFSKCSASEKLKSVAMAQYCPEEVFFKQQINTVENGRFEPSANITDAFKVFLTENDVKGNGFNINTYLERRNIKKARKRIDEDGYAVGEGNPIYVYEGIRLKNKYRV